MSNLERFFSKKLTPFREFPQIEDSFERLMSEFVNMKRDGAQAFTFSPSCEITEEGNNYILKFDMPGITKSQLKVEVNGDQLTVSAERKEEKKHETKKRFLSEVNYGSYSRTFTLPGPLDDKNVDAKFENGVLAVTVPKNEALHSKQIQVQ